MAAYEVIDSALVSVYVLGFVFVGFNVLLIDGLLALNLAWNDASDNIYLLSCIIDTVNLKGLFMDSSP